jgi:hypothetical protein
MLPSLDELLVERHALLAEGAGVRGIGREIAAHQAEDGLAVDLGLPRPAPQGAIPLTRPPRTPPSRWRRRTVCPELTRSDEEHLVPAG